jgi:hypothetical protein
VHSIGSSSGGYVLAMRLKVPDQRGDSMCRYVAEKAFVRAMACTGVIACHLYAADPSASYVNTAESSTRAFDVPAWVLLCEASRPAAAEQARALIEGEEFARLGVEVRGDAAVYALEICALSSPDMKG